MMCCGFQTQEGDDGEQRHNDSTLEGPTTARVKSLSTVEEIKSRRCSPMSRTEDVNYDLTRKILVNPPHTNNSHKPNCNPSGNDCTKESRIQVSLLVLQRLMALCLIRPTLELPATFKICLKIGRYSRNQDQFFR